jgi:TolB-like protein/DNA-binding winged helix-turn-helix (wHTH) protein/thioredoxin-like negative regulator of GroEL
MSFRLDLGCPVVRFGEFVFDPATGELHRDSGEQVRLRHQLSCILALLTSRAGEVVTREELRRALWGDRVVDFDRGLNFCMKRLRAALQDDADAPRFIETLPKRGYRFIAPVAPRTPVEPQRSPAIARDGSLRSRWTRRHTWAGLAVAALSLLAILGYLVRSDSWTFVAKTDPLRLAVLPFANMSGDPTQDFVGDGFTDDMTTQLGRLAPEHLVLVASTTTLQYKGSTKGTAGIGRELDVAYVLSGSVRLAERVHVNVRLIRVADATQIWSETYERTLGDLYATQREIAVGVAQSLALTLLSEQPTALARASTTNTPAYEQYLKGLMFLRRGTEADFRQAVTAFERALQEDSQLVIANTGLAAAHFLLHDYDMVSREATCNAMRRPVADALSRDNTLPQVHAWLAEFAAICASDLAGAEREYRYALELNPSDTATHRRYGWFLVTTGRAQQALEPMQRALALDPKSADAHAAVGYVLHQLGRDQAALARAREGLELDPQFPFAMYVSSQAYVALKRYPEAVTALERAVRASGRGPKYVFSLGMLYSAIGRVDDARELFEELSAMATRRYVPSDYLRTLASAVDRRQQTPVGDGV